MRVLALIPGGIGDQLLFFPTLDGLKRTYPEASIDVVVEPRAVGAYRVSKAVNSVIPYDFPADSSPSDWANLLGIMRDREYEVAITVTQSWSIALMLWLSGIPTRVGYAGGANKFLLSATVPLKTPQYLAAQFYDLLSCIGISGPCPDLGVNVPAGDVDWADKERERLGLPAGSGYVLMSPGSMAAVSQPDALYPVDSWQTIIQDFQQRQPELPIVLAQAIGDTLTPAIAEACPAVKVARPDNLGQLASLVAGADLVLAVDSATTQLSVALKVFTLGLFTTDPSLRLPEADRFIGLSSQGSAVAAIAPETVLQKVWGS